MKGATVAARRLGRRRFLGLTAAAAGCLVAPAVTRAAATPERALSFYNVHTGESLRRVYWAGGRYVDGALAEIDHLLRDFRTGEIKPIDRDLLDLLHRVNAILETEQPFTVISGYRSPETNAMLAGRNRGVARNSYHVHGMAIDLRVPERATADIRRVALDLAGGGVGYYPKSDFVHLDTGPVRRW